MVYADYPKKNVLEQQATELLIANRHGKNKPHVRQ
jgi:hypothetical protein